MDRLSLFARRARGQRGQVVPLIATLVVVAGLAVLALGQLGGAATERALARRAADAAALAGAAEGRPAAERVASQNGARVTRYRETAQEAEVVVAYGRAYAVANARREGGRGALRPGGPAPALRAALARAAQLLGHKPSVVRAGGLRAELTPAAMAELAPLAVAAGLCPSGPVHVEVCTGR